jgi:Family of unknown function (DUF5681)
VSLHGLKMTTPNLKAMMSPGAIRARWKPGQSGKMKGGPRRESFEALAFRVLDEVITDERTGRSMERRELILRAVYAQAAAGKPQALKLVLDRAWPKKVRHEVDAKARVVVLFDDQDRRELEAAGGLYQPDDEGED